MVFCSNRNYAPGSAFVVLRLLANKHRNLTIIIEITSIVIIAIIVIMIIATATPKLWRKYGTL